MFQSVLVKQWELENYPIQSRGASEGKTGVVNQMSDAQETEQAPAVKVARVYTGNFPITDSPF